MPFQPVYASIITIGDELLIGQTIDTNSAFIAQELNAIGVWVKRRIAVGDVWDDIWHALDEESKTADIIIITGGLGPTADDITKPLLCEYFGGKLVVNEAVLDHVKYLFEQVYRRPGPLLERNLRQAEVPDNCIVLHNARGTAPGMLFIKNISTVNGDNTKKIFISLPGVPYEMKGLIQNEVIPRLPQYFRMPIILHRTAFTAGQGESMIAEQIKDFEMALPSYMKLAYLPGYGMVKLRLTAIGENKDLMETELNYLFEQLKKLVRDYFVTDNDDPIEKVIGTILKNKGKTMGTAESCTGGYIAHLITSVPGSSAYYKGSIISYANEMKENLLGVRHDTIESVGAVSKETTLQMVRGAMERLKIDFAVATSGIMGPDGGSQEKPAGTVWIGIGNKEKIIARQFYFGFDRERNIKQTAHAALDFLRKFILANS